MSNYNEDLEFDSYNLLEEWQTQPALYMSYCGETADAQYELDTVKDKLDVTKAKVAIAIRTQTYALTPEGMKITDKSVEPLITADPDVQRLQNEFNVLKKEVYLLRKAEIAFEQRKKALENAVILTGREQYSAPVDRSGTMREKSTTNSVDKAEAKLKNKLKR